MMTEYLLEHVGAVAGQHYHHQQRANPSMDSGEIISALVIKPKGMAEQVQRFPFLSTLLARGLPL